MTDASLNSILQAVGVAIVVGVCVVYVIKRIARKRRTNTDCAGCPLADNCQSGCRKDSNNSGGCGCH